jgi:hypothetical protein
MDHEKITPDKVLKPHADATYKRDEQKDYVLMVQVTTENDLTRPKQQVTGTGPMDFETRREAFFHPMVTFSYEVIFELSEWTSVYATLGIKFPETERPTLNELFQAIARLVGFMDRPKMKLGTQTLWVGLQRCYDLSNAWNILGPGAKEISSA